VFHAAEYDVLCLRRDFGFRFNGLFDTMVAARILGRNAVGLGNMLEDEFGVHVNKRYQRANWGQRPLPDHLLDYARLDTHYLIELRNRLRAALQKSERWALAQEDFDRLRTFGLGKDGQPLKNDQQDEDKNVDPWRISGSYDLAPQQAAVLQELCRYRDRKARSINRPLFKVIGDRTLLAIASETPEDLEELGKLPGMSRKQVRRHGHKLLKAVRVGLQAQRIYPPRSPRLDNGHIERLDALRNWRKRRARGMGVRSDVVLPRDLLDMLAETNPRDRRQLEKALDEAPYRLEHFGDEILAALSGKG
jgi:ribonuclease D